MKKLYILSHLILLLICLLLLPSKGYATKSVEFKVEAARDNSKKPDSIYSSTQEEKKVYKQPSGPNPVGNKRPPSNR
ncbi:hypothetical protein SSX86_022455 [Deinandra increscens subsp. villosa]|uniref:Uncharacterized protein n=1 Tax=Deinandra increscens subsp. villosa TaxID=3103831 RepID=A0AAP0CIV3_9ASTR